MFRFLLVVLSTLLLSVSAQTSTPPIINPSSGRPPVITGISGCTAQSPLRTVNCGRPARLTLTGSGFMTGLERQVDPSFYLTVALHISMEDPANLYCMLDSDGFVDTRLTCNIMNYGFGQIPANVLYHVKLDNWISRNSTTVNDAVSFAPEPAPRVDSIMGCRQISPDRRTASQCDAANDQITLVGSGFRSVDGGLASVTLGSATKMLQLIVDQKFLIRIDDDEIVFNFGGSPDLIPAIEAQAGATLQFKLAEYSDPNLWSTAPVYISFLPLPDPVIRAVSASDWTQGCNADNTTTPTRFRDCISGLSTLTLQGEFLFEPLTITVNGIVCRIGGVFNGQVFVYMPIFQSVEGVFYDLTVTTVAGSVTLASIIEMDHSPLVYNVVPCIDVGTQSPLGITAHCMPGQTLTLKVLNTPSTTPRIYFRPVFNRSISMECPDVVVVDKQTITCTTPPIGSASQWGTYSAVTLWLEWQQGGIRSSDVVVSPLWDPENAPRISSLSGCDSDSGNPLHLTKCLGSTSPSGTLLTIHGIRFSQPLANNLTWQISINQVTTCDRPKVVNDQIITCTLPNLATQDGTWGGLFYNTKYDVSVQGFAERTSLRTNVAYITFVIQSPQTSSSSSTSASTIALATVFSIFGALLIGAALFYLCRAARVHKQRAALQSPEFSSTGQHVELEEV